MKVGIACAFRHNPDEDGALIPAASMIDDRPGEDGLPLDPRIIPIIGYMAISVGGHTFWNFVSYEAPECWHPSWNRPCKPARIGTSRVGEISCPHCGAVAIYPTWGDGSKVPCPFCRKKGVSVNLIKEKSSRFFEMLGNLKDSIEDAAKAAEQNPAAPEFAFPDLIVGGSNVEPGASVPEEIQSKARAKGMFLMSARDFPSAAALMEVMDGSLSIVPGVHSGILEEEDVRDGRSWASGALVNYIKVFLPKDIRPRPVRCCRYQNARL